MNLTGASDNQNLSIFWFQMDFSLVIQEIAGFKRSIWHIVYQEGLFKFIYLFFFCSEGILSSPQQCCYSVIQSNQTQLTQCQVCWFVSKKSKWCRLGNQHGLAQFLYLFTFFFCFSNTYFQIIFHLLLDFNIHTNTSINMLRWLIMNTESRETVILALVKVIKQTF